ncbi:MAG: FAD:protein FMN transferase [Phycisphaerae bacterium]|nr:FAD:protein FMN transferase [Phycisphaerae bacterium]
MKMDFTPHRTRFFVAVGAALLCAVGEGHVLASPAPLATIVVSGRTMGTGYTVRVRCDPDLWTPTQLTDEVERILGRIDARMSSYRPGSEVSRFNRRQQSDWFAVSAESAAVVAAAQEISVASGGALDVTAAPLVNLWGFGAVRPDRLPPAPSELALVRRRVGHTRLSVRPSPPAIRKQWPDLEIDLSALAKGYALDVVAARLGAMDIEHYLVEIGGEIKAGGRSERERPWRVGVESPSRSAPSIGAVVALDGNALATSGDYRNTVRAEGRRYCHIIDPRSGRPVEHDLAAASVIHDSGMQADGWATALMVLGPEQALATARRRGLAVRLVIRQGAGFIVRTTPPFQRWLLRDHLADSVGSRPAGG